MFNNYGKGDLVQYLTSKGYDVTGNENVEHLKVAAMLDFEARAFRDSPLIQEVAQNAERMIREGTNNQTENNDTSWLDNNDFF